MHRHDGLGHGGEPLTQRKASLERVLARAAPGLRFNEHLDEEDCKLGLKGIVSKRWDSPYSSVARATGSKVRIRCAGS